MTESSKPPLGRRMKGHAPPPPQVPQPAPRHIFRNSEPEGGRSSAVDGKENILRPSVDLQLTLPWGNQMSVTEDGSKALMDLLVELCGHHHLNPALHTLELLSPEGHSLGFKPNALLGSLNVACVLIKEKASEDKVARRPAPKVPEKTVRLMVNYHVSQKAVVRVNPLAPLQALVPVICNKCEFDPAHVLLLKDGISRHELPLGKSLTELGIKELYVHDQSIDSICSSTANLGRPQKKGLLGIFPFSGRKSQTETTAMDMDDCDDKIIQNTDTRSNGLSTVPGVYGIEPGTLGQSQSVANISRISTKTETKKRRAPAPPGAPTPSMGHTGFESNPVGLGSESQLRKRKAPAPPPTPSSLTQDSDYTSTPAAPTPESPTIEISTPAYRTKVAQSTRVSDASVVVQMVKPAPLKIAVQPPPVREASPTTSSPSPSSSTNDSLAVQDSSSELGHSLDDSDADLELSGSCCSTSSTASGSVQAQPATKSSRSTTLKSTSSPPAQKNQEETSDSSSRSETESALNLKLDEVENNRHSAIENGDRPVPPKPRRSPIREPRQLDSSPTLSVSPSPSPPIDPADSIPPQDPLEVEEAGPQSWLHSMQSSTGSGKKQETEAPEAETLSLDSSSGGSSLPDHGYAASEGMAEGEDSCMVSSPSDTLPTSPDGSLSQGGRSGEARGEKRLQPARDSSSDSDEGCATWRSKHRHSASHQAQSVKSNEDDSELTAQLHQTLADLEADLADHKDIVSEKDSRYTMSTNSNEVPVSVVDMDVPVTAIDEVLEEYEHDIIEHEGKSLTSTESAGSKGPCFNHKSCAEPQNKNNNAYTAAVSDKRSAKQYQSEQHRKSLDDKSPGDEKEVKMHKAKMKVDPRSVRETKKNVAVKSYVDMKNNGKNSEILPDPVNSNSQSFQQNKPALTPKKPASPPVTQRLGSPEKDEGMQRDYQGNSSLSTAHGKITCNVTSRLGMKTFTVVPPKPTVMHNATIQPAVAPVAGAIKIDDQGNLVKMSISRSKPRQSSESESDEASYLLGKAKAFWSSNERQENAVTERKSLFDKAMESTNDMDSAPTGGLEATLKTSHTEYQKTTRGTVSELAQTVQPKAVEEEAKKPLIVIKVANKDWADVGSKISVSKNVQQPNSKPALPPQLPQDLQKDLSFLKPPRRTSSHYVASALAKYTPKTSANPSSIPKAPDFSPSLKTQTATGLQISGWSMQETSSASSLSDDKEIVSSSIPNPPGPNRSMSYPEYVSHSQRDVGEEKLNRKRFENLAVSTKEGSNMSVTETSKNDNNQSSGSTLIKVTANNNGGHIKHIWPSSPSPTTSSAPHSFSKPPTAPKITSIAQRSGFRDVTKAATDVKPQHGVTVSHSDGTPGPAAVTVFGPVKKFKPVIQRSAEKETSLHSSLMEAIQTGGGRDGLKKISTSGPSNQKKETYVEEETERSALLAAIRAQSNSSRLRKTKSEAANELGKSTSEEERSVASSLSPPSLSSSSPVFKPPPPPPMVAPPPVLSQNKPGAVASPNTHTPMNPASPREAMLEAIRSGAAAERLKKVSVPKKTVQVNGRLGTVQAATSTLPQH
ncbi:protein cordon-bleu isoform 2-T2 [Odontesthes bonariensis]|uniref:protein cordon-bleu isoform X2 n=1 Tax=Odontesthes bonariensis TaxID=219752 RepID=UPI003F585608